MFPSQSKKGKFALLCTAIIGAFLLIGCSGGGGDSGPSGAAGPPGPTGPPGPVVTTDESCIVCHTAGKVADIAVAHPDPTGQDVVVSNILMRNVGGFPAISFHLATSSGPLTNVVVGDVRFYIADLVPAGTATDWGTWDTPYFERWAAETSPPSSAFSNDGGGDYTYTFATAFGSAAALGNAPNYDPSHSQRLLIRVSGHNDPVTGNSLTHNTVGFLDFYVPDVGQGAVTIDPQRMFVTINACEKCHGPFMDKAAHANSYLDTRACVICHSPLGVYGDEMQADSAYLSVFIHKIHAAIDIPKWTQEGRINGLGYSAVTYPQDIRDCVVCHTDSGLNLGTGNQIDNWKDHPTAEICGSCHINVNFVTGANHPGGVQTNNFCFVCHPASGPGFGLSVTDAHDTTPTGPNIPEFDVTLNISDPANGTYYTANEAPVVRVTLKNHETGLDVDPSIYTTAQDAAGVSGGGLNVASLYVYGPRAKSVPVLATGTVTDPAYDPETDPPTQEHGLFVDGEDPLAATSSNGFEYHLLPIPADMKPGTYMVRVRMGDYGRVGNGDYRIESTALTNIQIHTSKVEKKVAGDACINCHGAGTASFHDERHAVVFNTDECLACHDQSGNSAIPIANRVHAIHSANSDGDIYNIQGGSRDWSDVTYPQDIATCVACHTSGDATYKTLPFMMPCAGCHVGFPGVLDHMRQNGGPF